MGEDAISLMKYVLGENILDRVVFVRKTLKAGD